MRKSPTVRDDKDLRLKNEKGTELLNAVSAAIHSHGGESYYVVANVYSINAKKQLVPHFAAASDDESKSELELDLLSIAGPDQWVPLSRR